MYLSACQVRTQWYFFTTCVITFTSKPTKDKHSPWENSNHYHYSISGREFICPPRFPYVTVTCSVTASYLAKADSTLHDCNRHLTALLQPFPLSCSSRHGQIRGLEVSEVKKELQLSEIKLFRDSGSGPLLASLLLLLFLLVQWPRLSKCLRAISSPSPYAVCPGGHGVGHSRKVIWTSSPQLLEQSKLKQAGKHRPKRSALGRQGIRS